MRQVACVKKDVEINSPLQGHRHRSEDRPLQDYELRLSKELNLEISEAMREKIYKW